MTVFRKGDVVYHATRGKATVINPEGPYLKLADDSANKQHFSAKEEHTSFKPWPTPCHERSVEDGVWVCHTNNGLIIRKRLWGEWYVVDKDFKCTSGASFNYDKIAIKKITD